MTLEQRVEALEQTVKSLVCDEFAVSDGEVFISKALIRQGEVKAAVIQAADFKVWG